MIRRLLQDRERWPGGWGLGWLALWVGWLALAGCSVIQAPTPTLIPTLTHTPIPSATPSPLPSTVAPPTDTPFVAWRTVTLESLQSFDFRQEKVGAPTEGDLYYVPFDPLEGDACFWANNGKQVGGRDLGSWSQTALLEQALPRDRYSAECLPVIGGRAYVYGLNGDERLAVLHVVSTELTSVTFEYILRK